MSAIDSRAKGASLRDAIRAAVAYTDKNLSTLTSKQVEALTEIKRRLRRLEAEHNHLVKINNVLMDAELPRTVHDETTDTLTTHFGGVSHSIKLNRANPDVPVKLVRSAAISVYTPGKPTPNTSEEIEALKMRLESELEQYYYGAFRVTKLIQELTGRTKIHCKEITMVRNHLVEHPKDGSDYTFGYGTQGPVVRPIKRGIALWNDAGLVPNTVAFSKYVTGEFSS